MRRRTMVALLIGSAAGGAARLGADQPVEIHISAKKFEYHPNKVTAKLGQPLVFVLTSEDRIHGFKMPAFGLRSDIVPDRETRVGLTPNKAGNFAFICDIFCGDGHEEMEGVLTVEA